jgi:hypothetical protein
MGLTGKYQFRKSLWGRIVLQVEEEVKPLWSKTGGLKQRWRDATLMDLTAPEMRPLIDMRYKPHLWARTSLGLEARPVLREQDEAQAGIGGGAPVLNGEMRRIEH